MSPDWRRVIAVVEALNSDNYSPLPHCNEDFARATHRPAFSALAAIEKAQLPSRVYLPRLEHQRRNVAQVADGDKR